jgi:hypothetical protein
MDSKARQRLAVSHHVLEAIRNKQFRDQTLATRSKDHVFVPALPEDPMGILFDQVREAGGPIHVAVEDNDDLLIFVMAPIVPSRHSMPSTDAYERFPIDPGVSVGIVLDYLRMRDRPILCREANPQVSLELVEGPSEICVS